MPNKKILMVTRNFPPLIGGMEKLNFHICQVLSESFDVSVSGPKGSAQFHGQPHFSEFDASPLWKYVLSSLIKTLRLSVKQKPDVVFCGSGSAILAGFFAAKFTGAKLVCYLHGLDIVVDNLIYRRIFLPCIKKSDLVIVNSNHSRILAINAGINNRKVYVLPPGTMLPQLDNRQEREERFRKSYDLGSAPILLIVGRLTPRKGIVEFITNIMPRLLREHPQSKLLIIGADATAAINKQFGLKQKIQSHIGALAMENNIHLLGTINDECLSDAFCSARALIFPVLELANDVEGFGMVAIEAAAHGVPTIGFSVGGVPDAIKHGQSGWLISSGNYANMAQQIINLLNDSNDNRVTVDTAINYAKEFSWENFGMKLKNILAEVIK